MYNLSEAGKQMAYSEWKRIGGCSLANNTSAYVGLGPESQWSETFPTLGQIAKVCPATGRSLARFAVEHLNRVEMGVKI